MDNLSTTKKGDAFEKQVYELLKELLNNDELFMNGKKVKSFGKRSMYQLLHKIKSKLTYQLKHIWKVPMNTLR